MAASLMKQTVLTGKSAATVRPVILLEDHCSQRVDVVTSEVVQTAGVWSVPQLPAFRIASIYVY